MALFHLSEVYDALVNWPKRLVREEPFYRQVFQQVGAKSVADVACGSGRHAAMFHNWGLRVEAADVSPEMIELARRRFGQPPGLNWTVRSFEQPIPSGPFDAAICVGNSLALAPNRETLALALRQLLDAVRPGGAVVVQVLNLRRIPEGPCVWQAVKKVTVADRELLLIKGVHRCGPGGFVELVVVPTDSNEALHTEASALLGIEADWLQRALYEAGASTMALYGDYQRTPFDREKSVDILVVARK